MSGIVHSRPDPGTEAVAPEGHRWAGRQVGRILIVEHVPHFGPGRIESILWEHRLNPSRVLPYEGTPFPADISDLDGLILLGGPEAGDDSQWPLALTQEMTLIGRVLDRQIPILGISLGCQLLAATLGARITASRYWEIGWHETCLRAAASDDPLFKGEADRFMSFHWPTDIFDLPRGAMSLASSDLVEHQAFRWGQATYGVRFHLEITAPQILTLIHAFFPKSPELEDEAEPMAAGIGLHLPALRGLGDRVVGRWLDGVLARRKAQWQA